jgi:hypothetical protein
MAESGNSNKTGGYTLSCDDLHQILRSYSGAEPVVVFDEATEEFMQPALKDFFDPAVHQTRTHRAGLTLCRSLPTIGGRDVIEILHEIFVTVRQ